MRVFLLVALLSSGALHAIVLFQNPTCSGVVVGSYAILTLASCIGPNTELIAPVRLKPIRTVKHEDEQVELLFFESELPYSPIKLPGSRENLAWLHTGQKINIGNMLQSRDDQIIQLSATHIFGTIGLRPVLLGSPMWLVSEPTRSYSAIGIMTDDKNALRISRYINFISTNLAQQESPPSKKFISLPARPISEKRPLVSLEAQAVDSSSQAQTTNPQAGTEPPQADVKQPSTPQSIGCACSQVGSNSLRSRGFLRRFLRL